MKKARMLLLLGVCLMGGALQAQLADGSVPVTADYFPDSVFRSYIKSNFDKDQNGVLSEAELKNVTSVTLPKSVADATGIKLFPSISYLDVESNYVLRTLDLSGCTALKNLYCRSNNLLKTLDVSGCTALTSLYCGENQLTVLNMSGCMALESLNCYINRLPSLDVSDFPELKYLTCRGNPFKYLNISNYKYFCALDWDSDILNGTSELQELVAHNCTALEEVDLCDYRNIEILDLSGCTALVNLNFGSNPLTSLDVSGCASLMHLDGRGNQLTFLDVSGCTSLMHLDCNARVLDVSGCSSLTYLRCVTFDTLTSLDVSDCVALDTLVCGGGLTSLDVSQNTALVYLDCGNNRLKDLDVSQNTALAYLDCGNNQLKDLDVSQNTALTRLDCSSNQLTSLDISQNRGLTSLSCGSNQLISLDVSGCTVLEELKCSNNRLITLDLSKNEALRTLECRNNYREVVLDNQGCLDLGTLLGFEAGKAKDWSGGVLSGNTLEFQQGRVAYAYPTNNPLQPFINFYLIDNSPVAMPQIVLMYREAVYISAGTPDAVIYYTMDGTVPTEFSQRYEGLFAIAGAVTVKAIAVKDGVKSPVATATFTSVSAEDVSPASTLRVYAQDRIIYLSEPVGEVEVFTTVGRCVYRGTSTAIPVPRAGVYVVSAAGRKFKVGVR